MLDRKMLKFCQTCAYRNGHRHCEACRYKKEKMAQPSQYRKAETVFIQATAHSGYYGYAKSSIEDAEERYHKAGRRKR